jgi:hypothetical protein
VLVVLNVKGEKGQYIAVRLVTSSTQSTAGIFSSRAGFHGG